MSAALKREREAEKGWSARCISQRLGWQAVQVVCAGSPRRAAAAQSPQGDDGKEGALVRCEAGAHQQPVPEQLRSIVGGTASTPVTPAFDVHGYRAGVLWLSSDSSFSQGHIEACRLGKRRCLPTIQDMRVANLKPAWRRCVAALREAVSE